MNNVMANFYATVRQMTKISQQKKTDQDIIKYKYLHEIFDIGFLS